MREGLALPQQTIVDLDGLAEELGVDQGFH
jgi:hypothetical protein